MRKPVLLLVAGAALLGSGCGGADRLAVAGEPQVLLLDFQPNAVHAGLYVATAREYDDAEGTPLEIRRPGQSTDALKLLQAGDADLAILDIHDLGLARQRGAELVGVMAVVQRPLAAVLAQPRIRSPRELEGERAGVTGLPSDDAVLRAVVEGDGGDFSEVQRTTIGFEAVRALLARRVAAATAFWNAEGVALRSRRPGIREFRVDDFGAPAYPELVLVTTRSRLDSARGDVEAAVRAIQRGYEEVLADPESAVATMTEAVPELDAEGLATELDAVAPAFKAGAADFGRLDRGRLEEWASWDVEMGILSEPPDVEATFDFGVAAESGRD